MTLATSEVVSATRTTTNAAPQTWPPAGQPATAATATAKTTSGWVRRHLSATTGTTSRANAQGAGCCSRCGPP